MATASDVTYVRILKQMRRKDLSTKRNRLTDIVNKVVVSGGSGGGGINWQFEICRHNYYT